jgi:hypothetical protein
VHQEERRDERALRDRSRPVIDLEHEKKQHDGPLAARAATRSSVVAARIEPEERTVEHVRPPT